jgi:hypothetical protein
VAGATRSADFPTLDPYQAAQGDYDAFVTRLSPSGSSLVYSTYLGGSLEDAAYGIALGGLGDVYLTGSTDSTDFPVLDAYQVSFHGEGDAFVAKLAATAAPLLFHTVTPCRAVDTRDPAGSRGGPALICSPSPTARTFPLAGACGIPATARAISCNVTVTQATAPGHLKLFPAGSREPGTSSINHVVGVTRANNGVVALGSGNLNVSCRQSSGTAHAILDVNGYFE